MRRILIALCTFLPTLTPFLALTPPALAQDPDPRYVIHIEVDRPVLEPGETTEVRLLAGFDSDRDWAIMTVFGDLRMSDGSEGMSDFGRGPHLRGPGCDPVVVEPWGLSGICSWQYQSETSAIVADPSDPMIYFTAQFTASADMDRVIELTSENQVYRVYPVRLELRWESRLDELIEGSATLTIVACRADFNGDGVADLFDFLAFMNAFDAGDELADFDFDGALTVFDFLAFQNRFDAGC